MHFTKTYTVLPLILFGCLNSEEEKELDNFPDETSEPTAEPNEPESQEPDSVVNLQEAKYEPKACSHQLWESRHVLIPQHGRGNF